MSDKQQEPPTRVFQHREATDPRLTVTLGGIDLPTADDGTVPEDMEEVAEQTAIQIVSDALDEAHLTATWIAADYEDPSDE
jgi:hypothetical protein